MSDILRWCGIGLIMLSAVLIGREYSSFTDRRINEQAGFAALLLHMERSIEFSLSFGESLWRGFSDEALEKSGFLPLLREGREPLYAFETCRARLALSGETKRMLWEFFKDFGKSYKDAELKRIALVRGELEKFIAKDRPELEKNKRVINALLFGAAASAAIILL